MRGLRTPAAATPAAAGCPTAAGGRGGPQPLAGTPHVVVLERGGEGARPCLGASALQWTGAGLTANRRFRIRRPLPGRRVAGPGRRRRRACEGTLEALAHGSHPALQTGKPSSSPACERPQWSNSPTDSSVAAQASRLTRPSANVWTSPPATRIWRASSTTTPNASASSSAWTSPSRSGSGRPTRKMARSCARSVRTRSIRRSAG